jgi:hypothetical protein
MTEYATREWRCSRDDAVLIRVRVADSAGSHSSWLECSECHRVYDATNGELLREAP